MSMKQINLLFGCILLTFFAFMAYTARTTLEYWREAHWPYFVRELTELGYEVTPDLPCVCERFEVVFREPAEESPA